MFRSCCFKPLLAILFYSKISFRPLKLCNNSRRSIRHIRQKINEFASIALVPLVVILILQAPLFP